MKCPECKYDYPIELLAPMVMSGSDGIKQTKSICAICALDLSNKLHGTHRTHFNGEMAEEMRQQAIEHRSKNAKHE